jgi:hypothetical protein
MIEETHLLSFLLFCHFNKDLHLKTVPTHPRFIPDIKTLNHIKKNITYKHNLKLDAIKQTLKIGCIYIADLTPINQHIKINKTQHMMYDDLYHCA